MQLSKQKEFGTRIISRIAKLTEQLAERDEVGEPVKPDGAVGRLSRVDAMQQQEMRLAAVRQRKAELE